MVTSTVDDPNQIVTSDEPTEEAAEEGAENAPDEIGTYRFYLPLVQN